MATQTRPDAAPVYRMMLKDLWDCLPTVVVAGPNRRRTWLYVHALTPLVLRLHPPVVHFLRTVLSELANEPDRVPAGRSLPANPQLSYPECRVVGQGDDMWLYVFAATPSAVRLYPRTVTFLQDVLAELPARPELWANHVTNTDPTLLPSVLRRRRGSDLDDM